MNKNDLISAVSESSGLSKNDASQYEAGVQRVPLPALTGKGHWSTWKEPDQNEVYKKVNDQIGSFLEGVAARVFRAA